MVDFMDGKQHWGYLVEQGSLCHSRFSLSILLVICAHGMQFDRKSVGISVNEERQGNRSDGSISKATGKC